MTTLQIASDLHIERHPGIPEPHDYIIPTTEVLVLAGDIGSLYKIDQLRAFLEKLCRLFEAIIYIPGNHEFYTMSGYTHLSYKALENRLEGLGHTIDNLHILNRSSVRINNICIAGCTLWSNPKCMVPPFIVRVNGMTTSSYTKRHKEDLRFIKKIVGYCKEKNYELIVVTHHPPSYKALMGAKKRKQFISLYATDLEYLLNANDIKIWVCGHTHKNIDFISDKGCRIVSNQKGKPKDRIKDYLKSFKILL